MNHIRLSLAVLVLLFSSSALAQNAVCLAQPDGTCARPKVAAASTAAAATDLAQVVTSSPNGGNPCSNPGATLTSVFGSTSGTTAVEIVALSGTTKVFICSLTVTGVSGTTPTFSLVYGTGTNCGTGQAVMLGAWTTAANTLYAFAKPVAVAPAGQAICYLQTGTTPVSRYALTYVQQ